jgi:hypothetical protein
MLYLPSLLFYSSSSTGNRLKFVLLEQPNSVIMDDDHSELAQPRYDRPARIPLKAIEKYVDLISRYVIDY